MTVGRDEIIGHEATDWQGGPAAVKVMALSINRAERREEHNDWLTTKLFDETQRRIAAEFAHEALDTQHGVALARVGRQDREIAYWQTIGGWLLLAACTGWLAFGLVLPAYLRGL